MLKQTEIRLKVKLTTFQRAKGDELIGGVADFLRPSKES